jgi:hypothetical protein
MKKLGIALGILAVLAFSAVLVPRGLPAAAPPAASALADAHQALLTAALAEKKPYAEIVKEAVAAGMDCEEVALFLCGKGDNDAALVHEIVYAAITGGCDAEAVVSGALRAGAPLHTVVQAALAAGAGREAIAAAALKNGYTATQISNALAGISGGGAAGGGSAGEGALFGGPLGGGPLGTGSIGGGGGGAGGGNASPHKP